MVAGAIATISIPIAIHLLTRFRRRPQPWAAMQFLLLAQRRHRHRMKLEKWLLLALRCLIPLLVGLALSGPMLGGCAGDVGALLGVSQGESGRLVYLVIDEALSTQSVDRSDRSRFDQLRNVALEIINGLGPTDRVVVWRGAFPAEPVAVVGPPGSLSVREAITLMKPRYSRSDLVNALAMVQDGLIQDRHRPDHVFIVLLSDFANHVLPRDGSVSKQLGSLSKHGRLLVARPMHEVANVQITALRSRQRVILEAPGQPPATVPVEIRLRRFVDHESRSQTTLKIDAIRAGESKPFAATQLNHHWTVGQSEALVHTNLSLIHHGPSQLGVSTQTPITQLLTLRAQIDHPDTTDALKADNVRWLVLKLQQRVRIGLIDQERVDRLKIQSSDRLTPGRWIRLALEPHQKIGSASFTSEDEPSVRKSTLELEALSASYLNPQTLQTLDAALVLRPDLLVPQAWGELRRLADRGGLVWLFPPPDEPIGMWANAVSEDLGFPWQLGGESVPVGTDESNGMALVVDESIPGPLKLLAADWRALLAPVRIHKRFDWVVKSPETSSESVWLKTVDGQPILVSAVIGRGRVLLWATSIDPQWNNLSAKPLFVPLMHETIRGVLSEAGSVNKQGSGITSGQRPNLDKQWAGVEALVLGDSATDPSSKIRLIQSAVGIQPESVLVMPGIYHAVPAVGEAIPVNPDAMGGDTRTTDIDHLTHWLSTLGQWAWLDVHNPGSQLDVQVQRVGLGWPCLWVALILAVFEMFIARWFSYATVERSGWMARWLDFRFRRQDRLDIGGREGA